MGNGRRHPQRSILRRKRSRVRAGFVVGLILLIGSLAGRPAAAASAAASLEALRAEFTRRLAQPRFAAATWGVKVLSLDTGVTLFERNAGKLLKPASVAKLYSGALALDCFGPEHRVRTSLYARQRPDAQGVLAGDLVVYGRGDPTLAARFYGGDYTRSLEPLVAAIVAAGVRQITGDLVGDESYFRGPPCGVGWAWDDLQYYFGAEVSALSVDDNVVDLFLSADRRVNSPCHMITGPRTPILQWINRTRTVARGEAPRITVYRPIGENRVEVRGQLPLGTTNYPEAVAVHRPAPWFLARLKESLQQRSIGITGKLRIARWQDQTAPPVDYSRWVELGPALSRPMKEIVRVMLQRSQNLYAQLLLLGVGAREAGRPDDWPTTEAAGLAALRAFVRRVGVPEGEVQLEEGAGLSHGSAVTANATVALLKSMAGHRYAKAFRAALPVAGRAGSLRGRMKRTAAEGNVRAKPGSLHHVSTLAGYVTSAAGERLAFAFLLNHYAPPPGSPAGRAELDELVIQLAAFTGRSRP